MGQDITHVYRVQDSQGRGPWKPGFSHTWVEPRSDHDNLVPWFTEFGMIHRKCMTWETMGCGCETMDQLRRWFTEREYAKLQAAGYQAVRMEVGRVLGLSEIQCVFTRTKPLAKDTEPVDLY